jgi:hypothetical protein
LAVSTELLSHLREVQLIDLAWTQMQVDGQQQDETLGRALGQRQCGLAFLFDPMMAVHSSNVEPPPHQITGVYESLLPRQPLRFVLADDPGPGKTMIQQCRTLVSK